MKTTQKERGLLEKYEDYSRLSLCRELDQYKRHHESNMEVINLYQSAFHFLEKQQWFKNNRHKLVAFLKPLTTDSDK